jgi:hypothetical protein
MKLIKTVLHYWFVLVSLFSFLAGWGMLAHSPKPVQINQPSSAQDGLPALPPIQAYNGGSRNGGGLNFISPGDRSNVGFPLLRTGGS